MRLTIAIAAIFIASGCAAYQNTVTPDGPGRYHIKAIEAPDVWATNSTALDFNLNGQADKLCPNGWDRTEVKKTKQGGDMIYSTTITCSSN